MTWRNSIRYEYLSGSFEERHDLIIRNHVDLIDATTFLLSE